MTIFKEYVWDMIEYCKEAKDCDDCPYCELCGRIFEKTIMNPCEFGLENLLKRVNND